MPRWIPVLLVALLCSGCFVFDELDKGQKIMEQHSPKKGEAAEPAPPPTASRARKEEPGRIAGLLDSARSWWKRESAEAGPERDPDDTVVRCDLGERTQFTRKSDCLVRGGAIL